MLLFRRDFAKQIHIENRVILGDDEAPEVLGSFDARDSLGPADGVIAGGSSVPIYV